MNKLQFQIIQIKIVIVKQSTSVGLKKKKLNIILYTISIQFYNFSLSPSLSELFSEWFTTDFFYCITLVKKYYVKHVSRNSNITLSKNLIIFY